MNAFEKVSPDPTKVPPHEKSRERKEDADKTQKNVREFLRTQKKDVTHMVRAAIDNHLQEGIDHTQRLLDEAKKTGADPSTLPAELAKQKMVQQEVRKENTIIGMTRVMWRDGETFLGDALPRELNAAGISEEDTEAYVHWLFKKKPEYIEAMIIRPSLGHAIKPVPSEKDAKPGEIARIQKENSRVEDIMKQLDTTVPNFGLPKPTEEDLGEARAELDRIYNRK